MMRWKCVLTLSVCAGVSLMAQVQVAPPPGEGPVMVNIRSGSGPGMMGFISTEFSVDGKLQKGAPYSAQAVTETIQTLADGNRIVNKTTSQIARDGQGRTRREQTMKGLGPWSSGEQTSTVILINDPVAQANYVLEPQNHIARKTQSVSPDEMKARLNAKQEAEMKTQARVGGKTAPKAAEWQHPEVNPEMVAKHEAEMKAGAGGAHSMHAAGGEMAMESLGSKSIEGVQADGKRFTRTVPAGQVGNEKPLVYVNEVWTSADLGVIVMSRHIDPQMGETVYTLQNIQRSEPDPALFTVPADYTVHYTVQDGAQQWKVIQK